MENLVDFWRARPDELQAAIRQREQNYSGEPKFADTSLGRNILVLAANDDEIVLGVVIKDQVCDPEITRAFQEVHGFIHSLRSVKTPDRREQRFRLKFFLPYGGICRQEQTGIEGVPIEWLQWIPVDEDNIQIDKHPGARITPAEGNVEGGTIARLLGHLKWFADVAESAPREKPPIGWAFRIYNAAVRLQFHLTFSRGFMEHATRKEVSQFLLALEKLVKTGASITAPLRTPEGLAAARDTKIRKADRESLIKGVTKVLKFAVKAGVVFEIAAARVKTFEGAPDVAEMFQQLRKEGWGDTVQAKAAEERLDEQEPELADFCRALAGVVAARSPAVTGSLRPVVQAAAQDLSRDFLAVAADNLGKGYRKLAKSGSALVDALVAVEGQSSTPNP